MKLNSSLLEDDFARICWWIGVTLSEVISYTLTKNVPQDRWWYTYNMGWAAIGCGIAFFATKRSPEDLLGRELMLLFFLDVTVQIIGFIRYDTDIPLTLYISLNSGVMLLKAARLCWFFRVDGKQIGWPTSRSTATRYDAMACTIAVMCFVCAIPSRSLGYDTILEMALILLAIFTFHAFRTAKKVRADLTTANNAVAELNRLVHYLRQLNWNLRKKAMASEEERKALSLAAASIAKLTPEQRAMMNTMIDSYLEKTKPAASAPVVLELATR